MKLTFGQKKALLQIGFGVFGKIGGFYDEANNRLDIRSALALGRRGLIEYNPLGGLVSGSIITGGLRLSDSGWELFEILRYDREVLKKVKGG